MNPTTKKSGGIQLEFASRRVATQFEAGQSVRLTDGQLTHFSAKLWPIEASQGRNRFATIYFTDFPEWLRIHLKRLIAYKWLIEGRSLSALVQIPTGIRRCLEAIPQFSGPLLENLTPFHAQQIENHFRRRYEHGRRAIAAAEVEAGRKLSGRERRAIRTECNAIGERGIRIAIRNFNELIRIAREQGTEVDFELIIPREINPKPSRVGGTEPSKVVSDEELVAILDATRMEIDAYYQAREPLEELELLFNNYLASRDEQRTYRRLNRYLGIDGRKPISLGQIAIEEGLRDLPFRKLRPALVATVGEEAAKELIELRSKFRERGFAATPEERIEARRKLKKRVSEIDWTPLQNQRRSKFTVPFERVCGLNGYRVHGYKEAAALAQIPYYRFRSELKTRRPVANGRHNELWERVKAARVEVKKLHSRAIKACAICLIAVTARRIEALLELPAATMPKWIEHRGTKLFCIEFTSRKMWGDEGLPETVELPGYYGQVAESAISTARQLTECIRNEADEATREKLFITFAGIGPNVGTRHLSTKSLHQYFHSHRRDGLLVRYSIPRSKELSLHYFRHRLGSEVTGMTGQPRYAARILGNEPAQAATAYFSQGTEANRIEARKLAEGHQITGILFDATMRIKMEQNGQLDRTLPASELTVDEALRRLTDNPEFLADYMDGDERTTVEAVNRLLERGFAVNLTSRGGCMLPISEGPCPASEECPIGCDAAANESSPGCGCRWQVLIPHQLAIQTLTDDLAAMKEQRLYFKQQPGYGTWLSHFDRRIDIWERQLARMLALLGREVEVEAKDR